MAPLPFAFSRGAVFFSICALAFELVFDEITGIGVTVFGPDAPSIGHFLPKGSLVPTPIFLCPRPPVNDSFVPLAGIDVPSSFNFKSTVVAVFSFGEVSHILDALFDKGTLPVESVALETTMILHPTYREIAEAVVPCALEIANIEYAIGFSPDAFAFRIDVEVFIVDFHV